MIIESGVRVEPFAVVQPGSKVEAGSQLKAARKSRSRIVAEKKDPMAFMRALGQQAAAAKARAGGNSLHATRDMYQCVLSLSFAFGPLSRYLTLTKG